MGGAAGELPTEPRRAHAGRELSVRTIHLARVTGGGGIRSPGPEGASGRTVKLPNGAPRNPPRHIAAVRFVGGTELPAEVWFFVEQDPKMKREGHQHRIPEEGLRVPEQRLCREDEQDSSVHRMAAVAVEPAPDQEGRWIPGTRRTLSGAGE